MRFSSSVMIALLIAAPAMAQSSDSAKARAQAALALSQIKREAAPVCDAKCKASLALAARQRERGACLDDVGAAMDLAAKDGKMLFIWVGMTCHDEPGLRAEFPDAVHCYADKVNDNGSPRLLVGPLHDGTFRPIPRGQINATTPKVIRGIARPVTPSPVSLAPLPVMRAAASC